MRNSSPKIGQGGSWSRQRGERRGACWWCDCRWRGPACTWHRIDHRCEQPVAKMCAQNNVCTVWQDPHLARRALQPEGRAGRGEEVCVHCRTTHVRANGAAAASVGGSRERAEGCGDEGMHVGLHRARKAQNRERALLPTACQGLARKCARCRTSNHRGNESSRR